MSPNSFDIPRDFFIIVSNALVAHLGHVMREGPANPLDRYDEASRIHQAEQLNQKFVKAVREGDFRLIRLVFD